MLVVEALVKTDEDAKRDDVVPTLMFPTRSILRSDEPEDEAILNGTIPACAAIESDADGDEVPIPTRPVLVMVILSFPAPLG
jgi:hypothetical protein